MEQTSDYFSVGSFESRGIEVRKLAVPEFATAALGWLGLGVVLPGCVNRRASRAQLRFEVPHPSRWTGRLVGPVLAVAFRVTRISYAMGRRPARRTWSRRT